MKKHGIGITSLVMLICLAIGWSSIALAIDADSWGYMFGSSPNPSMKTVYEILDALEVEFNIDADRLYATGQSIIGLGTNSTVSIGAAYQGTVPTNACFAGVLDEVRLYDRELTAIEIADLTN